MVAPTIVPDTLTRLSQPWMDCLFVVPGDYAFSIDAAAEHVLGLSWMACADALMR